MKQGAGLPGALLSFFGTGSLPPLGRADFRLVKGYAMALVEEIEALREMALDALAAAASPEDLETVRVEFLGRSGRLKDLMSRIKEVPAADKKAVGQRLNAVKAELEGVLEARKGALTAAVPAAGPLPDPSLPGRGQPLGTLHPLTQAMERFTGIFERLGFTIRQGPEIEDTFHNFDALNMPDDHPVRDQADTFVLGDTAILRSQTSTVQIRV
ncbi:MAG: hypothetical protein LIP77_12115, partial [Planctomycetes bacterium]|nr:hypothetical protein [Planctomycetota bacterium]